MRRHTTKVILATTGIVAVLGTGVAVAADSSPCPWGNTPQAGSTAAARTNGDGTKQRLRKRDGTGPRHAQRAGARGTRGSGNRGADCPYRS